MPFSSFPLGQYSDSDSDPPAPPPLRAGGLIGLTLSLCVGVYLLSPLGVAVPTSPLGAAPASTLGVAERTMQARLGYNITANPLSIFLFALAFALSASQDIARAASFRACDAFARDYARNASRQ